MLNYNYIKGDCESTNLAYEETLIGESYTERDTPRKNTFREQIKKKKIRKAAFNIISKQIIMQRFSIYNQRN